MTDDIWAGGCQCGAVRYRVLVAPTHPYICHCRMCQKQFGNFFGAFVEIASRDFHLTRGHISYFKSSDEGVRGFCNACGTPLTYDYASQPRMTVSIGSFDRHSELQPEFQYGAEAREPWFEKLANLPSSKLGEGGGADTYTPEALEKIRLSSRQHPDHDTKSWSLPP